MKIQLKKSPVGETPLVRKTIKALGLRKIRQSREIDPSNKCLTGMVSKVRHLLEIKEAK